MTHSANLNTASTCLEELLAHKSVYGIPLLVLANKNDIEGALT